jgi:hypothetical protein
VPANLGADPGQLGDVLQVPAQHGGGRRRGRGRPQWPGRVPCHRGPLVVSEPPCVVGRTPPYGPGGADPNLLRRGSPRTGEPPVRPRAPRAG